MTTPTTYTIAFYRLPEKTKLVAFSNLTQSFIEKLAKIAPYFVSLISKSGFKENEKHKVNVCFEHITRELCISLMQHYKWRTSGAKGPDPAKGISIYALALANYLGDSNFDAPYFAGGSAVIFKKNVEEQWCRSEFPDTDILDRSLFYRETKEKIESSVVVDLPSGFYKMEEIKKMFVAGMEKYKEFKVFPDPWPIMDQILPMNKWNKGTASGNNEVHIQCAADSKEDLSTIVDHINKLGHINTFDTFTSSSSGGVQIRKIMSDYFAVSFTMAPKRSYSTDIESDFPNGLDEEQIQYCCDKYVEKFAGKWESGYRKLHRFWTVSPNLAKVIWEDNSDTVMEMFRLVKTSRASLAKKPVKEMLEYCDRIAKSQEPEFPEIIDSDEALKSIQSEYENIWATLAAKHSYELKYVIRNFTSEEIAAARKDSAGSHYKLIVDYYERLPLLEELWYRRYNELAAKARKRNARVGHGGKKIGKLVL